MLEQFLSQPETLLKGPYLSAQLPFRKSDLPLNFFPNLTLPFPPHAHQAQAFQRLGIEVPLPTLVATGTGSGKTECFMFPLLNHCAGVQANKARPVLPFVQLRSQLWLREMRRLVASVSKTPELVFADDVAVEDREHYLPVIHCRDCHATGWASLRHGQSVQLETDLDGIYRQFFEKGRSIVLAFPDNNDKPVSGVHQKLCPSCLKLNKQTNVQCGHCGHTDLLQVLIPDMLKERKDELEFANECPYCNSKQGISILGSQAASLSAVMIHQLYGSQFNEHKKLITFSDSVQDAAHRASFFTARTWPLMVRGQIASVLGEKETLPLDTFAARV